MDQATLDQWTRRICQATTLETLDAIYEELGALPPTHERVDLEQICLLVRHWVAAGLPLPEPLAWALSEAVPV